MDLTEDVFKLRNEVNNKFYMVTSELAAIKTVQKEMLEVQNRNCQIIEEHFELFQDSIHVLRDFDQLLFSRQQINFNYDTIACYYFGKFKKILRRNSHVPFYYAELNLVDSEQLLANFACSSTIAPKHSRECRGGTKSLQGKTFLSNSNG